jgi:hypothetical protein
LQVEVYESLGSPHVALVLILTGYCRFFRLDGLRQISADYSGTFDLTVQLTELIFNKVIMLPVGFEVELFRF